MPLMLAGCFFGIQKQPALFTLLKLCFQTAFRFILLISDTGRRPIVQPIARLPYPILHNALTKVLK